MQNETNQKPAFEMGQTVYENFGGTLPAKIVDIDTKGSYIHLYRVEYNDPQKNDKPTVSGWLFEYRLSSEKT